MKFRRLRPSRAVEFVCCRSAPHKAKRLNTRNRIAPLLLASGLAAIVLLGWRGLLSTQDARIVAIVFTCIVLWATSMVGGLLVSLLFFFLATTLTAVPTREIFSGFASSAFWLVFSGSAIGFSLKESGLSERIGLALARRIGGSYLKALFAFAVLSFLLSLVMPSTFGRVAILIPIAMGYCDVVHLKECANGRRGILLLVVVSSYELAAAVLPANLPNVITAGILEQAKGMHLSFSEYLLYFFPAGVLVRGTILVFASHWLFADKVDDLAITEVSKRVTARELHTIALLAITLLFWFTDSIHHIAPGWVGLGFTIAYFLTSPAEQLTRFTATVKMDLLWFIAAIIGLTALVNHLSVRIPDDLALASLRDSPIGGYLVLSAASVVLCFAVTSNAEPALFVPIVSRMLADASHLKAGLLSQVMGYGTTFLPYQSPPIVFGNDLARIDRRAAIKYCLATAVLGTLLVIPINALWWRLIGLL